MATRCFCPPLSCTPRSPTRVRYPSGMPTMKSCARARAPGHHRGIRVFVSRGLARSRRRPSRTEPEVFGERILDVGVVGRGVGRRFEVERVSTIRRVSTRVPDVVRDGPGEEHGFLTDDGHSAVQVLGRERRHVVAVERNRPEVGLVKVLEQVKHRALPAPARPHERHGAPGPRAASVRGARGDGPWTGTRSARPRASPRPVVASAAVAPNRAKLRRAVHQLEHPVAAPRSCTCSCTRPGGSPRTPAAATGTA